MFLASTLSIAVAVLGAEIFVRAFFRYNTPDTIRRHSLQYEPTIFARHVLKPGQRVTPDEAWGDRKSQGEPRRTYSVNERGYRGQNLLVPKPRSVCRLVVLGGSSVFDIYATEGQDWPHQIESLLQADGFKNVEVINAGVPGHASFDALGRLYSQIWTFDPDYVLFYEIWNDIKYWTTLTRDNPLIAQIHPYDATRDPFQNYRGLPDWVLSRSQVYVKLRNAYLVHSISPGLEGRAPFGGLRSDYELLGGRQFQLNLQLIVDASRNIGATPILLTQATLVTPGASPADRRRITYAYQGLDHDALVRAFEASAATVRAVAAEKGTPLLDVASHLSGRSELFEDHVHTNAKGSAALAAVVARFMAMRLRERPCPS